MCYIEKGLQKLESLKIEIKTLTPIWNGDLNRNCSEIKETGIIWSMRWLYKAIVRGMRGYACDPMADGNTFIHKKCEQNYNKFSKPIESCKLQVYYSVVIGQLMYLFIIMLGDK